jgi:hypothetical protein
VNKKPSLSPILTRRKWKLHAHGQHVVFVNGMRERFVHPLMKALIWALYLPDYPDMDVEIRIGDRYKPDVVGWQRDDVRFRENEPAFWGEAGQVGRDKIIALAKRYPDTHFCIGKYDMRLDPLETLVSSALEGVKRNAPFDLIRFPEDSARFIDEAGNITIAWHDVEWRRL